MKFFEKLNSVSNLGLFANGFAVGMAVQYMSNPLFKLNLANHNYRLGDKETHRGFFKAVSEARSESILAFMFKTPVSLLMRGGILGMIQMGLYKQLVTIIDRPNSTSSYFQVDKS